MRDLQADKEICDKATPGPWAVLGPCINDKTTYVVQDKYQIGDYRQAVCKTTHKPKMMDDALFVSAAREGWLEAIERAMTAEARVAKMQEILDKIARYADLMADADIEDMIAELDK